MMNPIKGLGGNLGKIWIPSVGIRVLWNEKFSYNLNVSFLQYTTSDFTQPFDSLSIDFKLSYLHHILRISLFIILGWIIEPPFPQRRTWEERKKKRFGRIKNEERREWRMWWLLLVVNEWRREEKNWRTAIDLHSHKEEQERRQKKENEP